MSNVKYGCYWCGWESCDINDVTEEDELARCLHQETCKPYKNKVVQ